MNHSLYRYRAIASDHAARIRTTLRDDDGNALSIWTSTEQGNPCRHCLRLTSPGERLILFTLDPFGAPGPYLERGPVFIHADPCAPYADESAFPHDFAERTLTLRAYGESDRAALGIVDAAVAAPQEREATLERLFANPQTAFVHARNPAWGCYDFRIERALDDAT